MGEITQKEYYASMARKALLNGETTAYRRYMTLIKRCEIHEKMKELAEMIGEAGVLEFLGYMSETFKSTVYEQA